MRLPAAAPLASARAAAEAGVPDVAPRAGEAAR